jgi:hypothetical protein
MKNIQLYEDFKYGTMKPTQGFFSKMAQGAKHAMGMESKEDREALDSIHNAIKSSSSYNWVTNVRELRPGVVVASIINGSVLVDKNSPEIIYKGKELDLHNLQDEADFLYTKLMNL